MPRKGMMGHFFSSKSSSSAISHGSSPSRASLYTPTSSFSSDAAMERTLATAETMITKWNADISSFAKVTSLFYENRKEARDYIKCVHDLQKSMHLLVMEDSNSEKLVRGQNLMETAMKRLQKEFYQILSMNRAHLDPESVSARISRSSTRSSTSDDDDDDGSEDEIRIAGESITEVEDVSAIAMADLRSIAEYIYTLGVEKFSSSQIQKMDWDALELKINNWLKSVKIAVKTLFNGERILCDQVFAASESESIKESCFTEISREGAQILFGFPEIVARSGKKLPEKIFRTLDMYTAISSHWPEIESIFSFESTSVVLSQSVNSLIKLGESVRTMMVEFESAIQKDASKSAIAGGGVHHLTIHVMDYLSLLADYSNVLVDILDGYPPPAKSSMPESYFDSSDSDESPAPAISLRFAWLILVLLCKLDGKSKHYKDVSLAYLFLANNLQHVINKVRTSNIQYLLGDDWVTKHESKVKQFAANYERLGWGHVIDSMPEDPTAEMSPEAVKEFFRRFNTAFEQAHHKQAACVVPDRKLRDEIKSTIARKVMAAYRQFYNTHRVVLRGERNLNLLVRFAPEDVGNYLSDLFFGNVGSWSSLSSSSGSSHSKTSRSR
ncbi:exocyst subunit exo70 family protein H4 [Actinidia rufa]|uniref:Exocyst subunit Exo70 family protein n=1 Tax=Actinidia rufa TaxID=165716 RepID=A0A7J0FWE1_9ERIC|nr:exocyst subunit exo70 family protein H4 [Actinidia rufa]